MKGWDESDALVREGWAAAIRIRPQLVTLLQPYFLLRMKFNFRLVYNYFSACIYLLF